MEQTQTIMSSCSFCVMFMMTIFALQNLPESINIDSKIWCGMLGVSILNILFINKLYKWITEIGWDNFKILSSFYFVLALIGMYLINSDDSCTQNIGLILLICSFFMAFNFVVLMAAI